jgi:predicted Fe-Mo cluster-binding NifX family protein
MGRNEEMDLEGEGNELKLITVGTAIPHPIMGVKSSTGEGPIVANHCRPSDVMTIAIPLTHDETFSVHFGGSALAAVFEVDLNHHAIAASGIFRPPGLAPCAWAPWLRDLGVTRLLVGGIGTGAREQMQACGIEVVSGITPGEAEMVVRSWMRGTLSVGGNTCTHPDAFHGHEHELVASRHAGRDPGSFCGCRHG